MGVFTVDMEIGDGRRERWTNVDALVDTGASITSVPGSTLRALGVEPLTRQTFRFAQGELRSMDVGQTWVRVDGREVVTLVLFNDEGTPPLLGALALESLFLGIDPVGKRLTAVDCPMMMARIAASQTSLGEKREE